MVKTNAIRLIEQTKIPYSLHEYDPEITDGEKVAEALGEDPSCVFKTLVCENQSKEHFVFVVPVNKELNLKLAAKASRSKSIALIHQKELLPLTGYVHGGCSPVGMKKRFPSFFDSSMERCSKVFVSAGKKGLQMEVDPKALATYCQAEFISLCS